MIWQYKINNTYCLNDHLIEECNTTKSSVTSNTKNQTTEIGSDSFTYGRASQAEHVQLNGTTDAYSGLGLSYESNSSGITYHTRDNRGNLVDERTPGGGRFYSLFDGLGSIVGVTDSSGALEGNQRYQYDPYGNLLSQPSNGTLQSNIWRYASGQFDSGTGLTKFGIRYDDTTTGRWTQHMPVGGSLQEMTKANPYACTQDDPVNLVDPSGKYSNRNALIACVVGGLTTLGGVYLAALAPVILATGPAGAVTFGTAILAILTGCLIGLLGYNLTQLFTGGF